MEASPSFPGAAAATAAEPVVTGAEVAPGVRRFDDGIVNWYLLEEDGAFTVVDAGLPPDWTMLITALGVLGRGLSDVRAVVLTHGHIDHIGFAERLRREGGVPVYVHEQDAGLLRSPLNIARSERNPLLYLGHPATRKLMMWALLTAAASAKRVSSYETFGDGAVLDVPGSPRVLHTPGHTDGHCALHLPDRDLIFSGDAIVTRNPYTDETGPRIVAQAATANSQRALASLDAVAASGAAMLLPGHGEPWHEGAGEAARLAREAGPS